MRAAILGTLALACAASESEHWHRDKAEHAIVGAAIGAAGAVTLGLATPETPAWKRAALAMVPVIVAGVGKEIYDRRHADRHDCESRDAIATIAGGVVGVSISFTF